MALRNHERNAFVFDVFVQRLGKHAPFPPLRELALLWKRAADEEYPPKEYESGDIRIAVGDVTLDDDAQTVSVLLRRSDKRAANATYSNLSTRKLRVIEKATDEGGEHAAHLVISLTPEAGQAQTYLGLLEGVPGLSFPTVQAVLNDVCRRACNADPKLFTYADPSGAKDKLTGQIKRKSYTPTVLFAGHPSDQFLHDIENGRLTGVSLFQTKAHKQFSASPYLTFKNHQVKLGVRPDIPKGERLAQIVAGIKGQELEFPRARISVLRPEDGRGVSIDVDTATGLPVTDGYVDSRRIGPINPLLENSSEKIVYHLDTELKKILLAERSI